jgi:hypothetical protein
LPYREIPMGHLLPAAKADLRPAPFKNESALLNRAQARRSSEPRAAEFRDSGPYIVFNRRTALHAFSDRRAVQCVLRISCRDQGCPAIFHARHPSLISRVDVFPRRRVDGFCLSRSNRREKGAQYSKARRTDPAFAHESISLETSIVQHQSLGLGRRRRIATS